MVNADGYAIMEINTKGEGRIRETDNGCFEVNFLDYRLEGFIDVDMDFLKNELEGQLPKGLKDVLVIVFFSYKSVECGHPLDGPEFEDSFVVLNHIILRNDYKEFYRAELTNMFHDVTLGAIYIGEDVEDYSKWLIANWEEFYGETFVPHKNGKKEDIFKIGDMMVGIDYGTPGGDRTAIVNAEEKENGNIEIKDVKLVEPEISAKGNEE